MFLTTVDSLARHLVDSLGHRMANQDSVLRALSMTTSHHPDTVYVDLLRQHPMLGLVGDVAKIMLGAVLALGTSWWMESRRRAQDDKRARRPLMIRVETEAHLVLIALQRLVESIDSPEMDAMPQNMLAELKPLLESFDRVQDRLYLLRNPGIESGLGVWYRKLRITVEQAVGADLLQSYEKSVIPGTPPKPGPPNQERASYRLRFVELQLEGNRLLDRIRKHD